MGLWLLRWTVCGAVVVVVDSVWGCGCSGVGGQCVVLSLGHYQNSALVLPLDGLYLPGRLCLRLVLTLVLRTWSRVSQAAADPATESGTMLLKEYVLCHVSRASVLEVFR